VPFHEECPPEGGTNNPADELQRLIVGTRKDLQEALQFAADGQVQATIEPQPIEAINPVFDRLRGGAVQGRVVLQLG